MSDLPRIAVTREHAEPLAGMLREAGAVPVHVPLLRLEATGAVAPAGRPDGVLVTSAAVARFVPDLRDRIGGSSVVAVGRKTARALERIGVHVAGTASDGGAEAVRRIDALLPEGAVAWYVGAEAPSPEVEEALERLVRPVRRWAVYRNLRPERAAAELRAALPLDVVTLASGSAARAWVEAGGPKDVAVAVIGRSTAKAARAVGLWVEAVAPEPSLEGLVQAALQAANPAGGRAPFSDGRQ